ncbi:hypothetical protein UNPF46_09305, partial [Bradyrhizobium sp. UNPF46]|uniref:hypothetical protein n=1 Tax=Bradyrhizobium sp. UNPF46 TaxID=1141168 RepID=UPI0011758FEC
TDVVTVSAVPLKVTVEDAAVAATVTLALLPVKVRMSFDPFSVTLAVLPFTTPELPALAIDSVSFVPLTVIVPPGVFSSTHPEFTSTVSLVPVTIRLLPSVSEIVVLLTFVVLGILASPEPAVDRRSR